MNIQSDTTSYDTLLCKKNKLHNFALYTLQLRCTMYYVRTVYAVVYSVKCTLDSATLLRILYMIIIIANLVILPRGLY